MEALWSVNFNGMKLRYGRDGFSNYDRSLALWTDFISLGQIAGFKGRGEREASE